MAKRAKAQLSSSPHKASPACKRAPRKATRPRKQPSKAAATTATRFTSVDEVAQMLSKTPSDSEDEDEEEEEEEELDAEGLDQDASVVYPESLEDEDIIRAIEFALAYAMQKASMADLRPASDGSHSSAPFPPTTEHSKVDHGGAQKVTETQKPQFLVREAPVVTEPATGSTTRSHSPVLASPSDEAGEATNMKPRLRPRSSLKLTERARENYRQ